MKPFAKITSVALLAALFSIGCEQSVCDDPVPSMTYDEFLWQDTIAILKYRFRDCDGDIGIGPNQNYPPYDSGSYYEFNYRANVYSLNNGVWEVALSTYDTNSIGLNSRITFLNDRSEDQELEGVIEKRIEPYADYFIPGDTIKFEVWIIDQALNESIPAESNPIIVPGI